MSKPVLMWIALGSGLAALVVIGLLLQRRSQRSADAKPPGFREIVRSPALWKQFLEKREAVRATAEEAQGWSDERVAAAVRRFVLDVSSSADDRGLEHVLKQLGPRTHPAALAILREPGIRERLVLPSGEDLVPEAPFNRLCKLLRNAPPAESIVLLGAYLDDASDEIRKDAALVLGESGNVAAAPFLRTALNDEDDYVRVYALMGLRGAARDDRLSDELKRALVGDVEQLLIRTPSTNDAADALFILDVERGRAFFLSEERFQPDSPILYEGIEQMNSLGIEIPRDRLRWLIDQMKKTDESVPYPRQRTLAESLRALGRHRNAEDRPLLEASLTHPIDRVATGAAYGLLAFERLEDFEQRIWSRLEADEIEALSREQRVWLAVNGMDAEVNNGGFTQYFFNSAGDDWKDALDGLDRMGMTERARIAREAVALFGKREPSTDRDVRMGQLADVENKRDDPFNTQDTGWYACREVVATRSIQYALRHAESFR